MHSDSDGIRPQKAALEEASITDFALWGGIVPGNLREMAELAERGVIGFKAFLCDSGLPEFPRADDVTLLEGMREAARLGLPVAVHAENEEITKTLTRRMLARAIRCCGVSRIAAGGGGSGSDPARRSLRA